MEAARIYIEVNARLRFIYTEIFVFSIYLMKPSLVLEHLIYIFILYFSDVPTIISTNILYELSNS